MPITDLLAEISGEKSAPSSHLHAGPTKRKAVDDVHSIGTLKAQKTTAVSGGSSLSRPSSSSLPTRLSDKPISSSLKSGAAPPPSERLSLSHKSSNGIVGRSDSLASRPVNGMNGGKPAPSHRLQDDTAAKTDSKSQPKKGSFAEVMARAQKAQAVMGQVGKIQHKPVEKGPSKKERQEIKAEMRSTIKKQLNPTAPGKSASTPSTSRNPSSRPAPSKGGHSRVGRPSAKAKRASDEERKPKKAASATTGYTGTARPKVNTPSKKSAPRGGALLNVRPPRRYEDEDDEDMDDFIEYDDDEEEEPGYGYGRGDEYDSDGSSGMEAGLEDIDGEERRAALIARREDDREEMLERQHKKEKEERKRKAGYY